MAEGGVHALVVEQVAQHRGADSRVGERLGVGVTEGVAGDPGWVEWHWLAVVVDEPGVERADAADRCRAVARR